MKKKEKLIIDCMYNETFELLPRDKNGVCIFDGNLKVYPMQIIPENFTVMGDLDCCNNGFKELPNNLTVMGFLDCSINKLKSLPSNLIANKGLDCSNNFIKTIPNDILINDYLDCSRNKISLLPDHLSKLEYIHIFDNEFPYWKTGNDDFEDIEVEEENTDLEGEKIIEFFEKQKQYLRGLKIKELKKS